jgi:maltooligosyltrehalose trehalohydrolase
MESHRHPPLGAEVVPGEGVYFRVWAPKCRSVDVVIYGDRAHECTLARQDEGYFAGHSAIATAGHKYHYRLNGEAVYPDPVSRFQPDGPHGPSQIVDPSSFSWSDAEWRGRALRGQVIYEMHVGTFTQEGTWNAAREQLPFLADIGVTVLELMPVADFPGRFGWGYDGVAQFAPSRLYGQPNDFRNFVNDAHRLGLAVILDVVYNHLGPDGNYLTAYSDNYFTKKYPNEWGDAINFDGEHSKAVREFFVANVGYWIDEYHLDGLRLDATQQMFDDSTPHILVEIGNRVRDAARGRETILVTENECQHARLVRPVDKGGYGLDGLWNDDFHHSAKVALTGKSDAYYSDYSGQPQEFLSAVKWGYLYQGQWYKWQKKRRGTPSLDLEPAAFINYIENHDQVANSGRGERIHKLCSPCRFRALTALLLLGPGTPMLFQGQEFGSSAPFFYFADHKPDLASLVKKGRADFLAQFRDLALKQSKAQFADPADEQTFLRCKLDLSEREKNAHVVRLHRDLLKLRRDDPAFRLQKRRAVDGAVLGESSFVLRFFCEREDGVGDRLLVVNLGRDLHLNPAPEPLLAPPEGCHWDTLWSSDDWAYGGCGTPPLDTDDNWRIPGEAAVVLWPVPGTSLQC